MKKNYIIAGLLVVGVGLGYYFTRPDASEIMPVASEINGDPLVLADVKLPVSLSDNAQLGKRIYEAKCAACHNANGAGQDGVAPPLIHVIYEPSHHGDESFQRAVANGVRGHHWPFGNMPPVEGLTRGDVQMIVTYIRELQRENGIY